ncbi:diguanylate cyclase response regulator, partial [Pseudomonas sp. CrR25]|nr:diguanylate cyclase response regulator [Pseudomonas sp. CrR25]
VIHQARQVLEVWQRLQRNEWNDSGMHELAEAALLLQRYAERFEQAEHHQLAQGIGHCLQTVADNRGRLNSGVISELNQLMQRLSRTGLRHGDRFEQTSLPPLRKPVYLALQHLERAERLAQQLEFFGMSAQPLDNANAFRAAMLERHPAAILMEVDFSGPGCGLQLAEA